MGRPRERSMMTMKSLSWWVTLTRRRKEKECDGSNERESAGGSDVSALLAFGGQLRLARHLQPRCNIHLKSTPLLAINFLFVNCNCTFLLPTIQMSLNAPFFFIASCFVIQLWVSL